MREIEKIIPKIDAEIEALIEDLKKIKASEDDLINLQIAIDQLTSARDMIEYVKPQ